MDEFGINDELPTWAAPRERKYAEFGRDHDGRPLKWIVFTAPDGCAILFSEQILDVQPYTQTEVETCTWEKSTLEEYVRKTLVLDLFTSDERRYLDGPPWVPERDEIERRFPRDEDRVAYPTPHAASCAPSAFDVARPGKYWLSTPGDDFCIQFVRPDGDIDFSGYSACDETGLGVRLAMRLKVPLFYKPKWLPSFAFDDEVPF